jgi:hypothetical protein
MAKLRILARDRASRPFKKEKGNAIALSTLWIIPSRVGSLLYFSELCVITPESILKSNALHR